ncbi:MAG: IS256 family transposase [Spirochaetales bacterium]|nr:IS256 family transposase [Spirochaetales bacterium]
MKDSTQEVQFRKDTESMSVLDLIAREGARKMLQLALENEVQEYVDNHQKFTDETGKQIVVRNGYLPERDILTGVGALNLKQPRVRTRESNLQNVEEIFSSKILPRYLKRIPSIDNLIPLLYLKGISTNDFPTALSAILGDGVKGLSPANIVRLKKGWEDDYKEWSGRDLSNKEYVYFWVDGIYFNVRLENERSCILVIMGADKHGNKELVAVSDGYRESKLSWREILLDLKKRGLTISPKLAIGDGALAFWAALDEVFPETKRQRCWVHKTANILDKLPKSVQPKAKSLIHEIYMAPTKEDAVEAYNHFVEVYEAKYPKAVNTLVKDEKDLFNFYDFPAMHWTHIRTTNPIESTFATVRLRTKKTKGSGSRMATLTMVFKLALEAQKTWKKLKGHKLIPLVMEGRIFTDGELKEEAA